MLQVQATPLSRGGIGSKNKENILDTINTKKVLAYKTPGGLKTVQSSVIKTGNKSALKTHGADKKAVNPVERLKLAEVKNGTPQRLTVTRTALTKQTKPNPTTAKKKNLRVWKDSPDSDVKSAERSTLSKTNFELKHVDHQDLLGEKVKVQEEDQEIDVEYGPPNTIDQLSWTPDDADIIDIASLDIKIEPSLKPFVSRTIIEKCEKIKGDEPLNLEFEQLLLDDKDFVPPLPTLREDLDFEFDPLRFEDLVFNQSSKKLKKRTRYVGK